MERSYYAIIPANVRYDSELTPNAKLLYGEITALCNEKGYCWASNSYFSELYSVSKTSISKWVSQLIEKGYINSEIHYKEGTKEIDNRYLRIVHDPIKEKLNTPIEEKLKDNNTSFNNTSNKKNSSPKASNSEYSSEFLQFWEVYPKKVDKKKACEAYMKYRKTSENQIPISSIVQAVQKYANSIKDKKFIKNPTTYINGENWNDVLDNETPQVNIGTHDKQNYFNEELSASIDLDVSPF